MTAAFGPADDSGWWSCATPWGVGTITFHYRRVSSNPCPTTAPLGLSPAPLGGPCRIGYVDGSTETKLWYNANGQLARIQFEGSGLGKTALPEFHPEGCAAPARHTRLTSTFTSGR